MERYLEFTITDNQTYKTVEQVLKHQAHLTRRQISQAKFRPGGIQKNGLQCRINSPVCPGDQIRICLEEVSFVSDHIVPYGRSSAPDIL